jgi:4'-phosphopantetheinyl transferase
VNVDSMAMQQAIAATRRIEVAANEAMVWCVDLESAGPSVVAAAFSLLSAAERSRAERTVLPRARRQFVVARAVQRVLLGRVCSVHPAVLEFGYGPHGRPFITTPATDVRFNLSHAGAMAAYVVARRRQVGIDVESRHARRDIDTLAAFHFHPHERDDLMALDPSVRERAFLDAWVRKEAYLKAIGAGLSAPPDACRVSVRPGDRPALLEIDGDSFFAQGWALHPFAPGPNYVGTVAIDDVRCPVHVASTGSATEWLEAAA